MYLINEKKKIGGNHRRVKNGKKMFPKPRFRDGIKNGIGKSGPELGPGNTSYAESSRR